MIADLLPSVFAIKICARPRRTMTRPKLLLAAVLSLAAGAARADDCDASAAEIVARLGGAVERRTTVAILMKHPLASSISIGCPIGSSPKTLSVYADSAYPTAQYYDLVARAGALLTGITPAGVREGAIHCQGAALRSKDEIANLNLGKVRFECQAFSRDGGGTGITLYQKRSDH